MHLVEGCGLVGLSPQPPAMPASPPESPMGFPGVFLCGRGELPVVEFFGSRPGEKA